MKTENLGGTQTQENVTHTQKQNTINQATELSLRGTRFHI